MKKRKNLHTGYVLFSYMSQKVEKHFILYYYLLYIIIIFSVDFLTFLWKPLTTPKSNFIWRKRFQPIDEPTKKWYNIYVRLREPYSVFEK